MAPTNSAMIRKVAVTISLESKQLDDLNEIVGRTRINRSVLIREGIDWIVQKYSGRKALNNPNTLEPSSE